MDRLWTRRLMLDGIASQLNGEPAATLTIATVSSPRRERERARLHKVELRRQEWRRDNPAPSTLQRNRDYYEWFISRPEPSRDDEERDDSETAFVKERRREREKARLQLVAQRRKESRQQQRAQQYQNLPLLHAEPSEPIGRGEPAESPVSLVSPALQNAQEAVPQPSTATMVQRRKRGRPVDPNSARQRALAAGRSRPKPEYSQDHYDFMAERARKRQAKRDAAHAKHGAELARREVKRDLASLQRVLADRPASEHPAAEFDFWRERALPDPILQRRSLSEAYRYEAVARAKLAAAKAEVAAAASLTAQAQTTAEEEAAITAAEAAKANATLAEAVYVASAAVAWIARRSRRTMGSSVHASLKWLGQPWVRAAFKAVGLPEPTGRAELTMPT
uniref:Uncharacterized protein n=1 Tax=Haptolina brevifila TaxID=156173 RepID=A0A7S2IFF6_9EUKA